MSDTTLWKALKDAAAAEFPPGAAPPITGNAQTSSVSGVVVADFTIITWWAAAMALAAKRLGEMREFLKSHPAATLDTDPGFAKRRRDLEKEMVKAYQPQHVLVRRFPGAGRLFMASRATATATATIVSSKLTAFCPSHRSSPAARRGTERAGGPRAARAGNALQAGAMAPGVGRQPAAADDDD